MDENVLPFQDLGADQGLITASLEDSIMRRLMLLLGAALCFSGVAAAQNDPSTPTSVTLTSPSPKPSRSGGQRGPWELGANYLYERFDVGGNNTNMNGFHVSLTRFFGNWFGLEGAGNATFGTIVPTVTQHTYFYGGGPRVAMRKGKIVPWVHGLFGGVRVSLPASAGGTFTSFAYMAGGGVDLNLSQHLSWRVQVDYMSTRIAAATQNTIAVGTGIVFTF